MSTNRPENEPQHRAKDSKKYICSGETCPYCHGQGTCGSGEREANNHKHKFIVKDGDKAFPIMICEECEFELDKEYYDGYVVPLEQENKELRTRVAELTNHEEQTHKELGEILGTDDSLKNCALRLQNRLSTLEKDIKTVDGIDRSIVEDLQEENKELQNRLSTVEAENKKLKEVIAFCDEELSRLKTGKESQLMERLSTLLKASEGLASALQVCRREFEDLAVTCSEEGLNGTANACEEEARKVSVALADFRAVKETK